jgi:flagellar hook-length control protein FliK
MSADLNPIQSTTSPLAFLATLQGTALTDDFAILLDRGVTNTAPDELTAPTDSFPAAATGIPSSTASAGAIPAPIPAEIAIARADALATTLAPIRQAKPEPKSQPADAPAEATDARPEQMATPQFVRLAARPDAPRNVRKEAHDKDQPTPEHGAEKKPLNSALPSPALPEAPAIIEPVSVPVDAPRPQTVRDDEPEIVSRSRPIGKPEPVALPVSEIREAPARTLSPQLPLVALHEEEAVAPPTQTSPTPASVSKRTVGPISAKAPVVELPTLPAIAMAMPTQDVHTPKTTPVRASKIAGIALQLADAKPDPAITAPQIGVAEIAATAPGAAIATGASAVAPTDTIVDRQLDLVRNEQWLGELAHDIASTSGDDNRLSFRLMPHQLGRLDVDVTRSHNGLSLTIHTESDSAKAILAAAQPRLADEIRAQGLKLADTQMFSGDSRQSPGQDGFVRPAPLIESFLTSTEIADVSEPEQRDGRYA